MSNAYLFGAVCPARDTGVALVLPEANTGAMNLHLAELAKAIPQNTHAVIIIDGAGWHQTGGRLIVPGNLSLLFLPPYSPELNAQENIWQYLRQNFLAGRLFDTYDMPVARRGTPLSLKQAASNPSPLALGSSASVHRRIGIIPIHV